MSKIFFLTMIAWIVLGCSSCKRETLATYSTTNSVYFFNLIHGEYSDSSFISFGYADAATKDSAVQIIIQVTGSPANTDRPFKLVVNPLSTAVAGLHYEALPEVFQFPAHQVADTISIKLLRSADLKDKEVVLLLDLQENESFTTKLKEGGADATGQPLSLLTYRVFFSDIVVKPKGWVDTFGKFSPKKMDLLCSLGGITPAWLNAGDDDFVLLSTQYETKCSYIAELLGNYLAVMADAGTPVYYEDGVTLMATDDGD